MLFIAIQRESEISYQKEMVLFNPCIKSILPTKNVTSSQDSHSTCIHIYSIFPFAVAVAADALAAAADAGVAVIHDYTFGE